MARYALSALLCGLISASALARDVSGWRGDGTGRFADSDAPTSWGANKNVIWKTNLPVWSNASPVVSGDRIFVCAEPTTLICLSTRDGSILWQKENGYDTVASEDEKDSVAKAEELSKKVSELNGKSRGMRRQLKRNRNNQDLKKKAEAINKELAKAREEAKPYAKWASPSTHGVNGYSSPTPVTDGDKVYVFFSTGVAVCYDMKGNRIWAKLVEKPDHRWGHCMSPLLIDGTLVIHVRNVHGLDAATGKPKWQHKSEARWGSPVKARVGGRDYAVTANGEIIDARDGTAKTPPLRKLEFNSPLVHGDVLYLIQNGDKICLSSDDGSSFILEPGREYKELGKNTLDGFRGTPLVVGDRIYIRTLKALYCIGN